MKISEVMQRTGLTERTIRYYEEEGLVTPALTESGGRTYRDFDEENIRQLETAAALRKVLFSVEEIKRMTADSAAIPEVLEGYRARIQEASARMGDVLTVLDRLDPRYIADVDSLAKGFAFTGGKREVPAADTVQTLPAHSDYVAEPHFGKLDEDLPADRAERMEEFFEEQRRKIERGERLLGILMAGEILLNLASLILNFSGGQVFSLILNLVILVCLYAGQKWAQVVYIIFAVISEFSLFVALSMTYPTLAGTSYAEHPWLPALLVALVLLLAVWRIFGIIVVAASKDAKEYFEYKQG